MRAFALCVLIAAQSYAGLGDIAKNAGLEHMTLLFSASDLRAQEQKYESRVSGEDALFVALVVILNYQTHAKNPLSIAGSFDALSRALNQNGTTLELVTQQTEIRPQYGENIKTNWIFCLYVRHLSDHVYWVVIDRAGRRPPYVYGFN